VKLVSSCQNLQLEQFYNFGTCRKFPMVLLVFLAVAESLSMTIFVISAVAESPAEKNLAISVIAEEQAKFYLD